MKLARLQVLSDADIEAIHGAFLDILSGCGIEVDDPETRNFLQERGCVVDGAVIRLSPSFIEDAVAKAVNRGAIELMRASFGGDLDSQVYGISQLSPTSPLYLERGVLEAVRDTLTTNVPLAILPEPNAGVSAPYFLVGLLTVDNAECLAALAIIQALKPGAGVLYANSWTTTDMHSGAALVGSAETTICRIAGAQLARFESEIA